MLGRSARRGAARGLAGQQRWSVESGGQGRGRACAGAAVWRGLGVGRGELGGGAVGQGRRASGSACLRVELVSLVEESGGDELCREVVRTCVGAR